MRSTIESLSVMCWLFCLVWSSLLFYINAEAPFCNTNPSGLLGYNQSCSYSSQCVTGLCSASRCLCDNGTSYNTCAFKCVNDCNSTVNGTTGTITSPGYPSSSTTTYCTWNIQGLPATYIGFNLTYLDMGTDNSCASNYIEIFDGPSTSNRTFGKMCTSWETLTISTTNNMLVVFRTSGTGRFLAYFKTLIDGKEKLIVPLTEDNGAILYYKHSEELFDFINETHLKIGHGRPTWMEKELKCQKDLIDMQSKPDGKYKFILSYQDHLTKFILLRALETKRAEEVAY
ncbi:tolloid-like protein 2 [Physella acuta]|uniref:tolloid-like protein 2 n=1 Tax=Physella acuta TaxID=109671 RepID=UPI0027DE8F3E|nr:tolloid-like protein 2 [Physella acuta]